MLVTIFDLESMPSVLVVEVFAHGSTVAATIRELIARSGENLGLAISAIAVHPPPSPPISSFSDRPHIPHPWLG
jgi:hypothetical protein